MSMTMDVSALWSLGDGRPHDGYDLRRNSHWLLRVMYGTYASEHLYSIL